MSTPFNKSGGSRTLCRDKRRAMAATTVTTAADERERERRLFSGYGQYRTGLQSADVIPYLLFDIFYSIPSDGKLDSNVPMVTNKRGALYFKYLSMEQVEAADSKDREQDVSTDAENTEEGIIKVVGEKEVTRGDEETKENVETVQSEIGGEEEENERVKGHSVVENAAPTDAVEDKVDPTAHHPLVIGIAIRSHAG